MPWLLQINSVTNKRFSKFLKNKESSLEKIVTVLTYSSHARTRNVCAGYLLEKLKHFQKWKPKKKFSTSFSSRKKWHYFTKKKFRGKRKSNRCYIWKKKDYYAKLCPQKTIDKVINSLLEIIDLDDADVEWLDYKKCFVGLGRLVVSRLGFWNLKNEEVRQANPIKLLIVFKEKLFKLMKSFS